MQQSNDTLSYKNATGKLPCTAETMYRLSTDDTIREQCEAREDYYRHQRTIQKKMEQQIAQIVEQGTTIAEQGAQLEYMQRSKALYKALTKDGRYDDLQRAYDDTEFLHFLLTEYHL